MKNKLKFNIIFKQKNIFIIIIIIIIIIIFIGILGYYRKSIEPYDDTVGTQRNSDGRSWGNSQIQTSAISNECNIGGICTTSAGQWGIYNANCVCIANTIGGSNSSAKTSSKTAVSSSFMPSSAFNMPVLPVKDPNCVSNTSDFDAICKSQNIRYQVTDLKKCNDYESKPICGLIDNDEEDINIKTPCLNKSDDFNTWCRFYSNKNIPIGYNVNSIGVKNVLVGADGGCFVNGKPDNNKARGICTYNYTDEVIKLEPANPDINYNVFTQCKYMNGTDFVNECSKLLKVPYNVAYATEITSYDCNPGFARAKCLNSKDKLPYKENEYPINTTTNSSSRTICKCTN